MDVNLLKNKSVNDNDNNNDSGFNFYTLHTLSDDFKKKSAKLSSRKPSGLQALRKKSKSSPENSNNSNSNCNSNSKRSMLLTELRKSSSKLLLSSTLKNTHSQESGEDQFDRRYEMIDILGQGTSSVVKRCKNLGDSKEYAAKIIRTSDPEMIMQVTNEYNNLKCVNNENIIKVYEMFISKNKPRAVIVMEFCKGLSTIEQIVEKTGPLCEDIARKIFIKILRGIFSLHKNGICHRDIKPDNILTSIRGDEVKIIDFNVSKRKELGGSFNKSIKWNMTMLTHTGTLEYSAPEILEGFREYTEQVDMWSAGVILFYMLSGKSPFITESMSDTISKISLGDYSMDGDEWSQISSEAKSLITHLIQVDPNARLSAYQALKHQWIEMGREDVINENKKCSQSNVLVEKRLKEKLMDHISNEKKEEINEREPILEWDLRLHKCKTMLKVNFALRPDNHT